MGVSRQPSPPAVASCLYPVMVPDPVNCRISLGMLLPAVPEPPLSLSWKSKDSQGRALSLCPGAANLTPGGKLLAGSASGEAKEPLTQAKEGLGHHQPAGGDQFPGELQKLSGLTAETLLGGRGHGIKVPSLIPAGHVILDTWQPFQASVYPSVKCGQ